MALTVKHRTDTFMSGWGPATGRTNRLILPCESAAEAEDVAAYARSRTDTKDVKVVREKPRLAAGTLWQVMEPEDSSAWYRLRDGGAS